MFFAAGICLGFLFGSLSKDRAYETGLAQGRAETKAKYQKKIEEIFPSSPEPEEIYFVSGKVTKIEGQTLTLAVTLPAFNPLEDPEIVTMTAKLQDLTKIAKQILKSITELTKEAEAFANGVSDTPPSPYKELEINLSELEIGKSVSVESEYNIKGQTEFQVKKVVLISD